MHLCVFECVSEAARGVPVCTYGIHVCVCVCCVCACVCERVSECILREVIIIFICENPVLLKSLHQQVGEIGPDWVDGEHRHG